MRLLIKAIVKKIAETVFIFTVVLDELKLDPIVTNNVLAINTKLPMPNIGLFGLSLLV